MNTEERRHPTGSRDGAVSAAAQFQSSSLASSSIARAALAQLPRRGVVFVGSGAAAVHFAQACTQSSESADSPEPTATDGADTASPLSFVTHSIPVALELSSTADWDVQLLGGAVDYATQSTGGDTALRTLALMRAEVAVIDAGALNINHGVSTHDAQQAAVESAMVTNAGKVVVLCDSEKFGQEALVSFAALDSIDVLITDTDASDEDVQKLTQHGIKIVRAATDQ
nr:lactose specific PTS system transcriptional repressor [Streptococcus thermophilus]